MYNIVAVCVRVYVKCTVGMKATTYLGSWCSCPCPPSLGVPEHEGGNGIVVFVVVVVPAQAEHPLGLLAAPRRRWGGHLHEF